MAKQGLTIKRLLGSEVSSSTWDKVSREGCAVVHACIEPAGAAVQAGCLGVKLRAYSK